MKATFTHASGNPPGFSSLALGMAVIVAMAALIATQSGASAAQSPVSLGIAGTFASWLRPRLPTLVPATSPGT
jgi:hypothetical protein